MMKVEAFAASAIRAYLTERRNAWAGVAGDPKYSTDRDRAEALTDELDIILDAIRAAENAERYGVREDDPAPDHPSTGG